MNPILWEEQTLITRRRFIAFFWMIYFFLILVQYLPPSLLSKFIIYTSWAALQSAENELKLITWILMCHDPLTLFQKIKPTNLRFFWLETFERYTQKNLMRNTTDEGNQFDTLSGLFLTSFSSFIKLLNQTRKEESKKKWGNTLSVFHHNKCYKID